MKPEPLSVTVQVISAVGFVIVLPERVPEGNAAIAGALVVPVAVLGR